MPLPALDGPQLFAIGLAMMAIVVLAVSARYVRRATAVLRAPDVDSIDGLDSGSLVRVSGTIQSIEEPITAPFSGVDCAVLRYAVEERRLSPVLLPWFVTIFERTATRPFTLGTTTGTVRVADAVRTVTLAQTLVASVDPEAEAPERVANFHRSVSAAPGWTIWRDPPKFLAGVARQLSIGRRHYLEQRAGEADAVTVVGRVGDGRVDPIVVSDRSPTGTLVRMARTTLAGLLIGVGTLAFATLLIVVA